MNKQQRMIEVITYFWQAVDALLLVLLFVNRYRMIDYADFAIRLQTERII